MRLSDQSVWMRKKQEVQSLMTVFVASIVLSVSNPANAATVLTSINVAAPTFGTLGSCPTVLAVGATCQLGGISGYPSYQIGVEAGSPNIFTITQTGNFWASFADSLITISGANTPFLSASLISATGAGTFGSGNISLSSGILNVTVPGTSTSGAVIRISLETEAVGAVPEPSTWAMMLVGFGAMGMAARRTRKAQSAVTMGRA